MLLHFSRVLYSLLILIFFSIADPDTDSQTANYAPSIISLDDGIRKVKFDSDPDYGTSNLAPPPDLLDHSSLAAPVLLSDAGCGQDINGKTDKGQSCTKNYRQPPQGSSTGQTDGGMEEAGQQAPIIPQGVPYVTKLGTLERDPSICPYPQRQVPVCSRYDVADLVGSTYVLQVCGPYNPIIGCEKHLLEILWCCLSARWRVQDNPQIRADPNLKKFEYEGVWCLPEGGLTILWPL